MNSLETVRADRTALMIQGGTDPKIVSDLLKAGAAPLAEDNGGLVALEVWSINGKYSSKAANSVWLDAVCLNPKQESLDRALAAAVFANEIYMARKLTLLGAGSPLSTRAPHGTSVLEWGLVGLARRAGEGLRSFRKFMPSEDTWLPSHYAWLNIARNDPFEINPGSGLEEVELPRLAQVWRQAQLPLVSWSSRLNACARRNLAPVSTIELSSEALLDWSRVDSQFSRFPQNEIRKLAAIALSQGAPISPDVWVAISVVLRTALGTPSTDEAWWQSKAGKLFQTEWVSIKERVSPTVAAWVQPRWAAAQLHQTLPVGVSQPGPRIRF